MTIELTKKEKSLLWVSSVFGLLLSVALVCFIVLYYLKSINDTLFVLGTLGFGCIIMLLAAINLNIKSSRFFTFFSFTMALLFAIGFAVALAIFFKNGDIVLSK